MNSFPITVIPIGLIIIALALTPWIQLFFQFSTDKETKKIVFRGALTTFSIVSMVFLVLLTLLKVIGEYGIYLMMLNFIFGSWLGYAITQATTQDNVFGPFMAKKKNS
ncbi:MAG: hypothetical protein ACRBFS_16045 [Aureispira sp.]